MNAQGGAVASLFKLCLDSFGVVMNWVLVHQQGALKEERHRLALWKESFDNDLDQLLESNEADRLKNMVLLFLESVANSLNKCLFPMFLLCSNGKEY
jgi:hypothetical protein